MKTNEETITSLKDMYRGEIEAYLTNTTCLEPGHEQSSVDVDDDELMAKRRMLDLSVGLAILEADRLIVERLSKAHPDLEWTSATIDIHITSADGDRCWNRWPTS